MTSSFQFLSVFLAIFSLVVVVCTHSLLDQFQLLESTSLQNDEEFRYTSVEVRVPILVY